MGRRLCGRRKQRRHGSVLSEFGGLGSAHRLRFVLAKFRPPNGLARWDVQNTGGRRGLPRRRPPTPTRVDPHALQHWLDGYDVVYTVREDNEGHALKEFVSARFYKLLRKLTGVDIPTGGADFRLLDRVVTDALLSCEERFVFVRGLVPWLGFPRIAVPYAARERFAGSTKYVFARMLRFALDGVFSFSTVPLRFISLLGAATVVLGVLYGFYSIGVRLFTDSAVSDGRRLSCWCSCSAEHNSLVSAFSASMSDASTRR